VAAALKPLHGAMKVARFLLTLHSKRLSGAIYYLIEVNGQPGIMVIMSDRIQSVTTFDTVDGSIQSIYTMRNPEKLKRIVSLGRQA
jgi:RNA polymerase sigma-70 factor, ECF subfamily